MLGYDLNVIERGIRGLFGREFITRQRKVRYPRFTQVVDSDKETEKYNAISTLPQLQELTDERTMAGFAEYSYEIQNKIYATGIKVPRKLFEFDQTGQLRTLVQSMGARVANFPDKLVLALLGANAACYDKTAFLGTGHDLGDGTSQVNDIAGHLDNTNITAATKVARDNMIAAFQMDLNTAKGQLLKLLDDRGEPWHEEAEPDGLLVLCHPMAELFVRTALEGVMVSESSNVFVKSVGGIITTNYPAPFTDISGVVRYGTWYLMKIDTPVQPLIFQRFAPKQNFPDIIPEADQAVLQALSAVEIQTVMRGGKDIDAHTFFDDEYLFGARTVYSAGYGMWQNVIRVKGSDFSS